MMDNQHLNNQNKTGGRSKETSGKSKADPDNEDNFIENLIKMCIVVLLNVEYVNQLAKLNLFGHWPTDRGVKGLVQRCCSYFILFWSLILFGAEMVSSWQAFQSADLIGTLMNVMEIFCGFQYYLATLVFVVYRKSLELTMNQLDELTKEVTEELGDIAIEEFGKRRKKSIFAYHVFFGSFIFVCHWAIRPILIMAIYGESTLIVHSWVPFPKDSKLGFCGNYAFQIIPCLSFSLGFCLLASIFVSLSEILLGHFTVLSIKLESMNYDKVQINDQLANCVNHHMRLLRICSQFRDITSIPLLTQCLFTVLALCIDMFELSEFKGASSGRIINVIVETQQELLILATYCWYGNEITTKSEGLLRPGYMTNWYCGTSSEKKKLLNIMARTMKPIYLGGFIKMDMLTFINVLKAAFSYYSFLAVLASRNAAE